jgi:hypothetical protein
MNIAAITHAFGLITGATERSAKEHQDFLGFYETLVKMASPEISKSFCRVSVKVGEKEALWLEMTPADYLWWREKIGGGTRFYDGVSTVRADILNNIANLGHAHKLNPAERAEFIDAMKSV